MKLSVIKYPQINFNYQTLIYKIHKNKNFNNKVSK